LLHAAVSVWNREGRTEEGSVDKVVHFEITVDDTARAKEFYGSIFDWELNDTDMGGGMTYTTLTTAPVDEKMMPKESGAINGGFTGRTSEVPHPVITIQVASIDDTLKKIDAAGGKTVTPRTPIPGMGAFAYFTDSEGNTMGLWETQM
jgi:predicted enzyme related to lactoylglutathione lyase